MTDLLIPFAFELVIALIFMVPLFNGIRKIRRLSRFAENTKGWILAVMLSVGLFFYHPFDWESTVDLDDLQTSTGALESRINSLDMKSSGFKYFYFCDSYFLMSINGDDKKYLDFNRCGNGASVSLRCKGKPITIWHKDCIVYQVEMNEQIIYSIENSNYRILIRNLTDFILYIFVMFYMPVICFAVGPHVRALREMEMREQFDETLTNETLNEDHSGKILRRFCKNCGAELGAIVEDRNAEDNLIKIEYEQYKFCANCGLESDPNMPIADKQSDKVGMWFIFFIIAALMFALFILIVVLVTLNVQGLLISIAMFAAIFKAMKLINMSNCPNCGREYKEEYFCPNCGTNLNRH